jgi:hypothetical protein
MTVTAFARVASVIVSLSCLSAFAQDEVAPPSATQSGARFRGGISGAGGFETVAGVAGPMFGLDGRLGVQLNDLIAIYAQPHLSFGTLAGLMTGTFSATALVDLTLADRFFVAAGAGYGVLNNPSGLVIHARAGGYPIMGRGEDGARRKGLMLGVDFRTYLTGIGTGIQVLGTIGYEAF